MKNFPIPGGPVKPAGVAYCVDDSDRAVSLTFNENGFFAYIDETDSGVKAFNPPLPAGFFKKNDSLGTFKADKNAHTVICTFDSFDSGKQTIITITVKANGSPC
jgi:hypothetical protein